MSIDTIGNFLTIIRNALMVSKPYARVPYSNLKYQIALILKEEGFIWDVRIDEENKPQKSLVLTLKYVEGESVIHEIVRVSKPSRRMYKGVTNLQPVIGGLGVSILTTNRGIVTNKKARQLGVGGEVLCTVW